MAKPTIRFKGYTDDWEQRKLGDSCKLNGRIGFRGYTEKDIISKEAGGVLTFSPTNIVDNKLTIECKNTYITREKYDESPEIKISNGDILFVKTGSTLGKSALVAGLKEDASINPQIVVMRVEKDTENFMSNVLITDRVMKQVAAVKIGGAVPTMTETELKNFTYFAPAEKEEKKKIGDHFRTLDNLITLHQRITPYFLKINAFVWEQRKLPEFVSFFNGLTYTPDDVEETGTLVLRSSNVKNGEIVDADNVYVNDKAVTSENVHEGDIIVVVRNGSRALIGKHAQIKASMPNTVIGAFMSGMRSEHSSFVNALLDTSAFENEIAKNMGATINQITGYMFSKMEFMIPSGDEQQKIGEHFQSLDNLITLHQRKPYFWNKFIVIDWEQRKLGDVFKEYSEKNHTELPALTIIQGGGTVKREDSDRNLMYDKSNLSNYKMVRKDDFIVHLRSFEGGLEKASSDGIISPAYHTFHSDVADSRFYYPYFRSHEFIKHKLVPHVYGIRDGRSIDIDGMKTIEIPYTSTEEQQKIGDYLESIDHHITLHQRKCEETKILKKYMLQKMFPQNGQKVPEIRFKGFTDDWEQRKLGDLVDRVTRKNQDLVSELPLTISAQYGLIDQNEFFDKRVASKDVSGYYLIENGEFAYNKSTSTDAPWGAIKRLDRYENGVLSTLYIVFGIKENNPIDSDFLVSYYSTNLWHKGIHEIAAEGARNHGLLNIAPADFFETKLMIPQDIEEQKKIGKYFEELERLITLHQRKCEELQNIKKFMLQNMFV